MGKIRLRNVSIQGFRSFGRARQTLECPDTVVAVWGGNSQGKTSLAEALEFLFTGHIARRELLASAKDEFADSLRNAHLASGSPVVVEAEILCADGTVRTLRRTLSEDYKGSSSCVSRLEIDRSPCAESDVEKTIGLTLMAAPLRAPVLAQHTLGYIFSAAPTDRAAYFRAVLDTQDIENFRSAVAALEQALPQPNSSELAGLSEIEAIAPIAAQAKKLRTSKTRLELDRNVSACLAALLEHLSIAPLSTQAERVVQLDGELERRRSNTFPVTLLGRKGLTQWRIPDDFGAGIDAFLKERATVDDRTRELVSLFSSALSIDTIDHAGHPLDCPLCESVGALTPERIAHIRGQVAANSAYGEAERGVRQGIGGLDSNLATFEQNITQAQPRFSQIASLERKRQGFRVLRVRELVKDDEAVSQWLTALRAVLRVSNKASVIVAEVRGLIKTALADLGKWKGAAGLQTSLDTLASAVATLEAAQGHYAEPSRKVGEAINATIDASSQTAGWGRLVELGRDPGKLWDGLSASRVHAAKMKQLQAAIKEIDSASGKVADEKFEDLSRDVKTWWDHLRPDEPSFFDAVKRRGAKTRRTIDLKVGLSVHNDRSDAKLRDAVAVFSQSQLHCLNLSLFLARTTRENVGFIVLDDPVLTSDDDFRPNFNSTVIEELLKRDVQVIVLTQDHASWKDIGHRWRHRNAGQFQLIKNDALTGSEIRNENDALATMLARAQPFISSNDPNQRKEGATQLRIALERFCKELLVRNRVAAGEAMASITDYDGQNYSTYREKVLPLLSKDPSHRGKLTAAFAYVTAGPHDDRPPSTSQLKNAAGDLKRFKKDYLD